MDKESRWPEEAFPEPGWRWYPGRSCPLKQWLQLLWGKKRNPKQAEMLTEPWKGASVCFCPAHPPHRCQRACAARG